MDKLLALLMKFQYKNVKNNHKINKLILNEIT